MAGFTSLPASVNTYACLQIQDVTVAIYFVWSELCIFTFLFPFTVAIAVKNLVVNQEFLMLKIPLVTQMQMSCIC